MACVDKNDHLERKPDDLEQIDFKPLEQSADSDQELVKKQKLFSVDNLNRQLLAHSL